MQAVKSFPCLPDGQDKSKRLSYYAVVYDTETLYGWQLGVWKLAPTNPSATWIHDNIGC
jgi:hypothetical protein